MNWKSLFILIGILFIFMGVCILFPSKEGYTNTYTGPNGNSITITRNNTMDGTTTDGTTTNGTTTDDTTTDSSQNMDSSSSYNSLMNSLSNFFGTTNTSTGPRGGTITTYQGNNGMNAVKVQGPQGQTYTNSNMNSNTNMNTNMNTSLSNNYDNYSHYNGSNYPVMYYGPNGATARIIQTANEDTIVVTSKDGHTDIYYIDNETDDNDNNNNTSASISKYYGPNGSSAKMITTSDGKMAVEITGPDGNKVIYTEDNRWNQPSDEYDNVDVNTYTGPRGGQAASVTGPNGNTAAAAQGPNGNTITGNTYDSNAYYNSLPQGIPRNQIPDGDEDLYILKSEVVPPVCPKCPDPILKCPGGKDLNDVPPCPPCARCPEPAFDCKKVPNYQAGNTSGFLPVPVLNDFSTFGM